MKGTGTEWDNQRYRENGGKMKWILEKGLTLGKRILITGFVVSSASVILPPLGVISAIGFACSIPCGFFLASYVCTEKLMSKLLPSPMHSPLLIENGMKDGYDDYEEQEEREDTWFGGDISTEEDQEELLGQPNGNVEARFEPIKKDKEEVNFLGEDVRPQKSSEKENVDEIVDENGYGEDLGEFVEQEEERPLKVTEIRTGVRAEENEPLVEASRDGVHKVSSVMITLEGEDGGNKFKEEVGPFETSMVVELCQVPDNEDDKRFVSETTRLTKDIRDDVESENEVIYNKKCVRILHEDAGEGDKKGNGDVKRIRVPFGNGNAGDSISVKGRIGTIEEETKENVDVQKIEDIGSLPDKRDVSNSLSNGHKRVMPKGKTGDRTADAAKQDLPTNIQQEIAISSSSDARAMAYESGFDLPDNMNAAYHKQSQAEYGKPAGGERANYRVCKVIESSEVIFPLRVGDYRHAEVPSERDVGMASDQVSYNGEEMWKQITALRAIVGFTGAPQKTWVEELRALYIVTGIEPPAPFKDPRDLAEVNDELRFLMSVVGVMVEA